MTFPSNYTMKASRRSNPLFAAGSSWYTYIVMRIRRENDIFDAGEIALISEASDALAHPLRVELFRFIYTENIARRQVCNKDLVREFGYSQSTISQHMRKLLISGLVEARKKESYSFYYVNLGVLGRYLNSVKKLNSPV